VNAQDYISSGLLEAYVLGSLSLTESEQVAGAICRFPEVAEEITRLEADLLLAAEQDAINPPAGLDDEIWAAIQSSGIRRQEVDITPPPVMPPLGKHAHKVIPFEGSARRPKLEAPWLRAAIWIALAGSLAGNMLLLSRRNSDERAIASLEQRVDQMGVNEQKLVAGLERYKHEAEMMAQPGMVPVPMLSTQPGHPMAATLYWDKAKNEAYVSVQKLPPPPAGMQYQLWAIADGKPVDIGMLDNEVAMSGGMQKVPKAVMAGQAFAVSLEKAGGSPVPTTDQIFLLGKMPA
jgi:anti-sigma-K factor RskA